MIIVAIIEFVVCFLILKWLQKKKTGEPYSKKKVARFLIFGALALIFALGISFVLPIERDMFFNFNPVLAGFLTAFITAALFEECVKYIFFRLALLKNNETKSWLDITIAAVILGIGFTFTENIEYIVSGSGNILRVFLPGHILFQFFMGYFYGKARVTGEKKYDALSLIVPMLIHTIYDMPIISLMVAIGDTDALQNADLEKLMQLPYYGYIIPLFVCIIAVAIAMFIGLIVSAKKINTWSKNGEKQETMDKALCS